MSGIDAVRSYCGWHVAPSATETVKVEGDGGSVLLLPSLRVSDVAEVRDESGNVVTGWKWRENGVVRRSTWQDGELYEFDITHGYDEVPTEVQEIADKIDADGMGSGALRSVTEGPFSESYDTATAALSMRSILDRYRLGPRP